MSKAKKDIIILVIGKILQISIALVSIKILTEILSTQEVGNYYLLLTVLTLFNFTFLNPLGQYYGRHLVSWKKSKNILNATVVLIGLRILAIVLALCGAYVVYTYFEYSQYYTLSEFLWFVFISLVSGTFMVLLSAVNTLGDRSTFIKYLVSYLLTSLILSLLIVYFLDKRAVFWLYGIAIAQLLFFIPVYRYLIQSNRFSIDVIKRSFNKKYMKRVFYFIFPITITLFLQWGQNISYRFIIEAKYSIEILAFIAVGFSVSSAIYSAVEGLMTQYFNPIYLRKITDVTKDERTKAWNELANYVIPIYIVLTYYIMVLSPYLVQILVAKKFHDAYIYTMLGAVFEFLRVVTNLVYLVSQSEIKTNTTIVPYTIGFIFTIITLYFVDLHDYLWTIPTVLIVAYVIIFWTLLLSMKKLLPIKIKLQSVLKAILLSLPLSIVYFLDTNYSIVITIGIIIVAGIYLLVSLYILRPKESMV